jgi:hypothetical protein
MKGIYLLGFMMFFGIVIMIYSSYRMMNVLEERKLTTPSNSQVESSTNPSVLITDPDVQPYLTGSFAGLVLFIVGAIGGIIVIVKAFTRRF